MSKWEHAICDDCWIKRSTQPDPAVSRLLSEPREPHRIAMRITEICCFCSRPTGSGIYVRENPSLTKCKGECK